MVEEILRFDDVLIPRGNLEIDTQCEFSPSRVVSLADYTDSTPDSSHANQPRLEDVNYEGVKVVGIFIEGHNGYGSSPHLSKDDFERLKKSYYATSNENMIGKSVTAVYQNNVFAGFLVGVLDKSDIKRNRLERDLAEVNT